MSEKVFFIYLFIFGYAGSSLLHMEFSCGEQGLLSSFATGFSLGWLLFLWSMGSRASGLQWLQPEGARTWAQ